MASLAIGIVHCLEPTPEDALQLVQSLGIPTVQIYYPSAQDTPSGRARIQAARSKSGIEITSIITAGDFVHPQGRAERIAEVDRASDFAGSLNVGRLQTHIGFVPEDQSDPSYPDIVDAMRSVCDIVAQRDQVFALETGQETAAGLRRFIDAVDRPNLRVNFDPANMVLYGKDNPIDSLDALIPFIDGVHCKDGCWPTQEGKLGIEMPLGQGEVDFDRWLVKLIGLGYRGPLTIEREIGGPQQQADILMARDLIESVKTRLGV